MHNKWVKISWNGGSISHTIICIYILYEFCIQIVNIVFKMYTFCRSELMYTTCMQNVSHILTIFIYILDTKFSCHSSFNFVNKMYTKVCWNVGRIVYTLLYILYNFCIQNVYTISVWDWIEPGCWIVYFFYNI